MGKKAETNFKDNRVAPDLKKLKNTYFVKIQQVGIRGTPDYLLCVRSHFVGLELKKDSKVEPEELQKYELAQIKKAGGVGLVAHPDNWKTIYEIICKLDRGEILPKDVEEIYI